MHLNQLRKSCFSLLLAILCLAGCGGYNPFCGSSRPKPVIFSLSPNSATLAQVQQSFVMTVNGGNFYSSSLIIWNGASLPTVVVSSSQMKATITTTQISAAGTAQVYVHTPSNLSGDLDCSSGGDSATLTFTVT
jgi:hypothetical protein